MEKENLLWRLGEMRSFSVKSSKSGMSMSVYSCQGEIKRKFTVRGWGFDRIGEVFAKILVKYFLDLLQDLDEKKFYGFYKKDGKVILNGDCGKESMNSIFNAIGLDCRWVCEAGGYTVYSITECKGEKSC